MRSRSMIRIGRIKTGQKPGNRRHFFDQAPENTPDNAIPQNNDDRYIKKVHTVSAHSCESYDHHSYKEVRVYRRGCKVIGVHLPPPHRVRLADILKKL
ncbi:MAG: hypothetical protein C4518_19530 [Desulfobacteraceae bacterium]|nr:MAG: hypothetical protein C4518_19530 [Desulfobacteraceae bacterium]